MNFCRIWLLVIWYVSRLATASSYQISFQWPKTRVLGSRYSKITLDWYLGACWSKKQMPIFRQPFEPQPIFAYKNGINDPLTKRRSSPKQFPHEEWCFNLEGYLWHVSLPGVDKSKEKNKRKIDCYVMHLENLIKSKRELKKLNSKKMMKNCINTNHFFSAWNCSSV